jgi:hypothetical protein
MPAADLSSDVHESPWGLNAIQISDQIMRDELDKCRILEKMIDWEIGSL